MRNNKPLAAAITTALSFVPGIVAGQTFENVNDSTQTMVDVTEPALTLLGVTPDVYGVPKPRFDFTGGETVVFVPKKGTSDTDPGGLIFASELFGTGNLVLPTPRAGKATGQYMAVIYTIDGDVVSNFEMTFTLDGGAVFAADPVLGVLDAAGGGSVTVSGVTAQANMSSAASLTAADSSLTPDTVFQFDTKSTLYQVSAATDTTGTTINFYELGNSLNQTPTNVPTASTKVYKSTGNAGMVTSVAVASGAITGVLATTGATALQVKDSSLFTQGWSYTCKTPYSGPTQQTTQAVFTVNNKVTTTTPHSLLVTVKPLTVAGTGNFASAAECTPADNIYRVHVTGDSVISVNAIAGFVKGHLYQFDNKGAAAAASNGPASVISHQTAQYMVTDIGTNTITIQQTGAATGLTTTIQDGEKLYDTAIEKGDSWVVSESTAGVPKRPKSSAVNKPSATFALNAGQTTPSLALANADQIMLLYKLGTVNKLAEPGQRVNMTVDLKAAYSGMVVNPQRTITVARSARALNAKIKSIEGGPLNIAVSTGSTQFIGEGGGMVGFVDNYIAQIGQIMVDTDDPSNVPLMEDGVTLFTLDNGAVLAEKSTLTITGGQFEASKTLPGRVYLQAGESNALVADSVTQDAEGWTAIWNLNTTQLGVIYQNSEEDSLTKSTTVRIQTDSLTAVNTVENKPHAVLNINYDNAAYQDVTVESDIRRITKDGTVCTVYNVPPPKTGVIGADQLSIRVTNDSALSGKLLGKLYSQEGGDPIWTGDLTTEEVPAGATVRFTSEDVATISGQTWDGRAVLEISTILPKIEVLALIRQNGIRMAPLSNLSAGAHGTSCAQN